MSKSNGLHSRTRRFSKGSEKKQGCYLSSALGALIIIGIASFWRGTIPFSFFQFWEGKLSLWEGIKSAWPIFVWGGCVCAYKVLRTKNSLFISKNAEKILKSGFLLSLQAGLFEEISFRWLIFYGAIVTAKVGNVITFGLIHWIFMNLAGPIANFFTLGLLANWIFFPGDWAVGAAMLFSNGKFREGHAYQGVFGYIDAWFFGMFMFGLMFQYGILTAIVVHFLYDAFLFVIFYLDAIIERRVSK